MTFWLLPLALAAAAACAAAWWWARREAARLRQRLGTAASELEHLQSALASAATLTVSRKAAGPNRSYTTRPRRWIWAGV